MAELSTLTYSITFNDKVLKELAALRDEVSQVRGSQLIHEAWADCQESKLGKRIANEEIEELKQAVSSLKLQITLLEHDKINSPTIEAYGEVIAKQVEDKYKKMLAEQEAVDHAINENWSLKLQRNSRGECICCGVGLGLTLEGSPFTVQGEQVYVNKTTVCDTPKESSVVTLDEDGVLKAFDENGTLRIRIQLPFKEKQ